MNREKEQKMVKQAQKATEREGEVVAWVAEMSRGSYLHINTCEDGNGTWFDCTESMWNAYWNENLERLEEICECEFSDYDVGYPKYHKVKFSFKVLETIES